MAKQPKKTRNDDKIRIREKEQQPEQPQLQLSWIQPMQLFGLPSIENVFGGMPKTDVMDKGNIIEVRVDLPGVQEKDIDLEVSNQTIRITASRSDGTEQNTAGYYYKESSTMGYQRLVTLPQPIVPKSAKANLENGILEIIARKAAA